MPQATCTRISIDCDCQAPLDWLLDEKGYCVPPHDSPVSIRAKICRAFELKLLCYYYFFFFLKKGHMDFRWVVFGLWSSEQSLRIPHGSQSPFSFCEEGGNQLYYEHSSKLTSTRVLWARRRTASWKSNAQLGRVLCTLTLKTGWGPLLVL